MAQMNSNEFKSQAIVADNYSLQSCQPNGHPQGWNNMNDMMIIIIMMMMMTIIITIIIIVIIITIIIIVIIVFSVPGLWLWASRWNTVWSLCPDSFCLACWMDYHEHVQHLGILSWPAKSLRDREREISNKNLSSNTSKYLVQQIPRPVNVV